MKIGSRLWISSEEVSMNIEPRPSAQMPAGRALNGARAAQEDGGLSEFMRDGTAGTTTRTRPAVEPCHPAGCARSGVRSTESVDAWRQ